MNAVGQRVEIGVEGADQNSGVVWLLSMQFDKILSVQRQQTMACYSSNPQNLIVRNSQPRQVELQNRLHVMAVFAQFLNNRKRYILISQQVRH